MRCRTCRWRRWRSCGCCPTSPSMASASVQTILLGQPQFRPILASKDVEQLRQRVLASYHLGPLTEAETRGYIEHRLRTVGWKNDPAWDDDAFARCIATPAAFRAGSTRFVPACCCSARWRKLHAIDAADRRCHGGGAAPAISATGWPRRRGATAPGGPRRTTSTLRRIETLERLAARQEQDLPAHARSAGGQSVGRARHDRV